MKKVLLALSMAACCMNSFHAFANDENPSFVSDDPQENACKGPQCANPQLPPGAVQITPCIPGMGEHWARPQDVPYGPIYGVYNHKVVFVEIVIPQSDFIAGKSGADLLKPPGNYRADHVDIQFLKTGPDLQVPHYQIHSYFVPHTTHLAFCR